MPFSGFYTGGIASLAVIYMHENNKCLFMWEKWNLTNLYWYSRPFIIELHSIFLVQSPSTYPLKAHTSTILDCISNTFKFSCFNAFVHSSLFSKNACQHWLHLLKAPQALKYFARAHFFSPILISLRYLSSSVTYS